MKFISGFLRLISATRTVYRHKVEFHEDIPVPHACRAEAGLLLT